MQNLSQLNIDDRSDTSQRNADGSARARVGPITKSTERRFRVVSIPALQTYKKVPGSNLSPETACTD